MKPSLVFMIRLSGSVKLRCALSSGTPLGGAFAAPLGRHLAVRTLAGGGLRLRLERRLCLADLGQPPLFVGNPIGQFVTTPVTAVLAILGRVLSGRLLHLARNLGGELLLGPSHPAVAHRLVLGGIRLNLGAVERDMAELDQTSFAAQPEDLYKQTR